VEGIATEDLGTLPGTTRGFSLALGERTWTGTRCTIGSHSSNDLVIDDTTVSRFHAEVWIDDAGVRIRDLGSRNAVIVDGTRVVDGYLRDGSTIALGRAKLRHEPRTVPAAPRLAERTSFGGLVGGSHAMRATYALLERAAASDVTVILEGETGTGKGAMADAIHAASTRKAGPFVVVDCGALTTSLLESELFGHERGAFTGADVRRIGALEEASGGTVFLDEIGELPPDLQPKLLRVLENREVRRVGQNSYTPIDVRVIAATHRDLRADVNSGRFRADLYYRLAVLPIPVPPLRQRTEDLAELVRVILEDLEAPAAVAAALLDPEHVQRLAAHAWPGNVRELRNHVERSVVLESPEPVVVASDARAAGVAAHLKYADARRHAIDAFERAYLGEVLRAHDGKVAAAARTAGIARVYFYRLLQRHGLK
jgi:two-component system, NtrC family, response regulator GlrR